MKRVLFVLLTASLVFFLFACADETPSADKTQRVRQEQIQQEGVAQVGMPAITSFFEAKQLKRICEIRDHGFDGSGPMHTYTYTENMIPTIVHGHTAMGGKFTFMFDSVGYGFPYATQFSNPSKLERVYNASAYYFVMPQAEPNLLFTPSAAAGTWVLVADPTGKSKELMPIYCEPNVLVVPFKLPLD